MPPRPRQGRYRRPRAGGLGLTGEAVRPRCLPCHLRLVGSRPWAVAGPGPPPAWFWGGGGGLKVDFFHGDRQPSSVASKDTFLELLTHS